MVGPATFEQQGAASLHRNFDLIEAWFRSSVEVRSFHRYATEGFLTGVSAYDQDDRLMRDSGHRRGGDAGRSVFAAHAGDKPEKVRCSRPRPRDGALVHPVQASVATKGPTTGTFRPQWATGPPASTCQSQ